MSMRKFQQNKLWRDNMVARVEQMGSTVHYVKLDDAAYDQQLRLKLKEEADEVARARDRKELVAELADVFEAIDALSALHGISKDEVLVLQTAKREDRGGFYDRLFVTVAEHPADSYLEKYCLAEPEKYPEVL
jgi:predicted house-cleaning noncanonical NTP pyrophosphatase (MazG superfamily)